MKIERQNFLGHKPDAEKAFIGEIVREIKQISPNKSIQNKILALLYKTLKSIDNFEESYRGTYWNNLVVFTKLGSLYKEDTPKTIDELEEEI